MRPWLARSAVLTGLLSGFLLGPACGGDDGTGPGDRTPPVVGAVEVREVTAHSAEVCWTTNEAARSTVFWSPDTTAGWQETTDSAYVTSHSVAVGGLAAETAYFAAARSADASGNVSARSAAVGFETFGTQPTLLLDPWEEVVGPGDEIEIDVRVLNMTDLFGASFSLTMADFFGAGLRLAPSSSRLRFAGDTLVAGPFLDSPRQFLFFYDAATDTLEAAVTRLSPADGVTGDGTLARLSLVALSPGSVEIVVPQSSVALRDPSGGLIAEPGELVVRNALVTVIPSEDRRKPR